MSAVQQININPDTLSVTRLTGNIGAEITGIDLRGPLSDVEKDRLRTLFLAHNVLVFPDQPLTPAQLAAFGRIFGELQTYPLKHNVLDEEVPELQMVTEAGRADVWHIDFSWHVTPPAAIILQAVELPEAGGDTIWSSAIKAYDGLPDEVKERIDLFYAIHDMTRLPGHILSKEDLIKRRRDFPVIAHPVVRSHPETGQKLLNLNALLTSQIIGIELAESDKLLAYLFDQFKRPEYQLRVRWRPHTLVLWDNRAVLHYGVNDYGGPDRRRLQRVTIKGDRPYR